MEVGVADDGKGGSTVGEWEDRAREDGGSQGRWCMGKGRRMEEVRGRERIGHDIRRQGEIELLEREELLV